MSQNPVIEIVIFKIKEGISEADYLNAVAGTQRFLAEVGGVVDRKLYKNEDGQWLDVVMWESMDLAMQAGEQFLTAPDSQPMLAMLDEQSAQMWHFHAVDIPNPTV